MTRRIGTALAGETTDPGPARRIAANIAKLPELLQSPMRYFPEAAE
jgi:hypothetical protein